MIKFQLFYNEFKHWVKSKNFSKINYKENKDKLFSKLEYLRLIYLLLENKTFGLILDIIRYPSLLYKLKLLLIYFTPLHLIKLKSKYF